MRPAGSPPLGKAGDLPFINDRLDAGNHSGGAATAGGGQPPPPAAGNHTGGREPHKDELWHVS